jgi:cytochrome c5
MLKRMVRTIVPVALVAGGLMLAAASTTGCANGAGKHAPEASLAAAQEKAPSASSSGKSGNQLWAETCTQCHNNRDPGTYSDVNWSIAMHHMRIRADLNAADSRKILEFLQSAN